ADRFSQGCGASTSPARAKLAASLGWARKVAARSQAARRAGFGKQNIVEKLAGAFRPGEGKRVRSRLAARNFKCRETSSTQVRVENAGAAHTDNVERPRYRQRRHRQATGECFEQDHAERIGPARKHQDVRRGIKDGERVASLRAEEMRLRIA